MIVTMASESAKSTIQNWNVWPVSSSVYSSKFSVQVMIGQQKYAQYQRPMW